MAIQEPKKKKSGSQAKSQLSPSLVHALANVAKTQYNCDKLAAQPN